MIKEDTKARLLDEGTRLFLERGYNDTGVQDVLSAASVPKGSFYHYFRSKEDFGLQVVHRYGHGVREYLDKLLRDERQPPSARIRRFFEEVFEKFAEQGCRHGCLLGTLGQELAEVNDAFRTAIHGHLGHWSVQIAECLEEAAGRDELPSGTDPQAMGRLLIDGFQGAALRMRLERDRAPLDRFLEHYFGEGAAKP